jgi:hypothetical protein
MNPSAFINTYWLVESIKVYQEVGGSRPIEPPKESFMLQVQPAFGVG